MDKFGIVIQARMNSSRLPGKILMDFGGKPMLLFQIDILNQFQLNATVTVATSSNPMDDQVEQLCQKYGIPYLRGSEDHVFKRYWDVANELQFDHIVRLTGDNPLPNYEIIKTCMDEHCKDLPDLTSTRRVYPDHFIERFAPKGSSVDVIKCETLLGIDPDSLDEFQREHVIPIFFNGDYEVELVKDFEYLDAVYTVDDADDYKRVSIHAKSLISSGHLLRELGLPSAKS